jgi:hypothetical protein
MGREAHHIRSILIIFMHATSGPAAPVLPRLPALLTMISRDGISRGNGHCNEARQFGRAFSFPGLTCSPRRRQPQKEARSTGGRRPGFSYSTHSLSTQTGIVTDLIGGPGQNDATNACFEKRHTWRRDLMNKRPGSAEQVGMRSRDNKHSATHPLARAHATALAHFL